MNKKLKIIGLALAGLIVLFVVVGASFKYHTDRHYFDGYSSLDPLDVRIAEESERPDYIRTHLYFKGWRGQEVPTLLAMPKERKGPAPCIIFLHGIGQSKGFMDEIAGPFVKAGFAFATFDQYTRGERKNKDWNALQEANAFRLRPAYTINDTRRLIDYLETRTDIAPNRIYLFGASYGAITGATAAALDTRLKAAVLIYGGGDINKLLQAREVAVGAGTWMPLARLVGWYFFSAADPVQYIGRISPRPVYLQNGKDDSLISTPAAEALQAAAGEPKQIQWYDGDHIGLDEATLWQVLKDGLKFVEKVDQNVVAS